MRMPSLVAWVRSERDAASAAHLELFRRTINDGHGDDERYRRFCSGRAAGLGPSFAGSIRRRRRSDRAASKNILQVYAIAARVPGVAVENPRQCSAWRYPRQYGPTAPGFARGMRAPTQFPQLYISGTAAVVGHESHHAGDIEAQLHETLMNLESLLQSAQSRTALGKASGDILKVYVRQSPNDAASLIESTLRSSESATTVPMLLAAEAISVAPELLLEIDGVHSGTKDAVEPKSGCVKPMRVRIGVRTRWSVYKSTTRMPR